MGMDGGSPWVSIPDRAPQPMVGQGVLGYGWVPQGSCPRKWPTNQAGQRLVAEQGASPPGSMCRRAGRISQELRDPEVAASEGMAWPPCQQPQLCIHRNLSPILDLTDATWTEVKPGAESPVNVGWQSGEGIPSLIHSHIHRVPSLSLVLGMPSLRQIQTCPSWS